MLGFFRVAKTTQEFFWVLYFSSAQINNNISAIYSFVFVEVEVGMSVSFPEDK